MDSKHNHLNKRQNWHLFIGYILILSLILNKMYMLIQSCGAQYPPGAFTYDSIEHKSRIPSKL